MKNLSVIYRNFKGKNQRSEKRPGNGEYQIELWELLFRRCL